MKNRTKIVVIGATVLVLSAVGAGAAFSSSDDDGTEVPITGIELEQATAAALAATGEGTVTETEKGDEESLYEVEVLLDHGSSVDVQLDENFEVVDVMADDDERDD